MTLVAGCAADGRGPTPSYDPVTRRLVRLDLDSNGDGRIDTRTYLDGNRPFRTEVDTDGDGRVDRWEYLDAGGALARIGSSSAGDGVQDTWTLAVGEDGLQEVDLSRFRDGRVDRREFFRGDTLERAEEDVDGDGLVDKWETWDAGALRVVAFDTTFSTGRPDRRLTYDAGGRLIQLEADPDGDGRFERMDLPAAGAPVRQP
ncbi:MAG: hypothetical protein AB7V01_11500 [Vicinamibacterales bacterium]